MADAPSVPDAEGAVDSEIETHGTSAVDSGKMSNANATATSSTKLSDPCGSSEADVNLAKDTALDDVAERNMGTRFTVNASTEPSNNADDLPSLIPITDNSRGAAYIYEDNKVVGLTKKILEDYENWLRNIGLNVFIEQAGAPASKVNVTNQVSIFVFWQSEKTEEKLCPIEGINNMKKSPLSDESPKLLIFCREIPYNEAPTEATKKEIEELRQQEKFDTKNFFLLYLAADEGNLESFLKQIKELYDNKDDKDYRGGRPCISALNFAEELSACRHPNFCMKNRLQEGVKLRIEARSFETSLLRKKVAEKCSWEEFSPFAKPIIQQDADESYANSCNGRVLIISNEKFKSNNDFRRGTRLDVQNLLDLLTKLYYPPENITVETDKTCKEMLDSINSFAGDGAEENADKKSESKPAHGDFAILVILSHGSNDFVYDNDGERIPLEVLTQPIVNSKSLAGRPKLILVNTCRIDEESAASLEYSSPAPLGRSTRNTAWRYGAAYYDSKRVSLIENPPNCAGLIIGHATTPGNKCFGLAYSGSRFISAFCTVAYELAADHDVLSMINKINFAMTQSQASSKQLSAAISPKQISSWVVETIKKFYLVRTEVFKAAEGGVQANEE